MGIEPDGRVLRTALELFSGIGAFGLVARELEIEVVAAVDQNRLANRVYASNLGLEPRPLAIESIPVESLPAADIWWLSPPCTPFTHRGRQRDDEDPRSRALLALLDGLEGLGLGGPDAVLVENVEGFVGSRVHARLLEVLAAGGREVREFDLCPTVFGVPMRRPRHFVVGRRTAPVLDPQLDPDHRPLEAFLDPDPDVQLRLRADLKRLYQGALHTVESTDPNALLGCFTRAYGRSPVKSGSYLSQGDSVRRFSPAEILRLLDFPADYRLPPGISTRVGWRLAGNSVDLRAIRSLVRPLVNGSPVRGADRSDS